MIIKKWPTKVNFFIYLLGDYGPFQLLCPITYNFVTVDERVYGIINKIIKEHDKNVRLAP